MAAGVFLRYPNDMRYLSHMRYLRYLNCTRYSHFVSFAFGNLPQLEDEGS
jgi:hypothetical protein